MGFLFDWLVFNSREVIASSDFHSRPTMCLRGPLGIYTDERSEFSKGEFLRTHFVGPIVWKRFFLYYWEINLDPPYDPFEKPPLIGWLVGWVGVFTS